MRQSAASSDYILSNHRGHGHAIAKGADPEAMMKELHGPRRRYQRRQGWLHAHCRFFPSACSAANGVLRGRADHGGRRGAGNLVLQAAKTPSSPCSSATAPPIRGPFYEALNWAMIYELPILFVCENNTYASSTATGSVVTAGDGTGGAGRGLRHARVRCRRQRSSWRSTSWPPTSIARRCAAAPGRTFLHARKPIASRAHLARPDAVPPGRRDRALLVQGRADRALRRLARSKTASTRTEIDAGPR